MSECGLFWVGVYGALFWVGVSGGKWGITLGGWGRWGRVGVDGGEWGWDALFDNAQWIFSFSSSYGNFLLSEKV